MRRHSRQHSGGFDAINQPIADQFRRIIKNVGTFIPSIKKPAINGGRHKFNQQIAGLRVGQPQLFTNLNHLEHRFCCTERKKPPRKKANRKGAAESPALAGILRFTNEEQVLSKHPEAINDEWIERIVAQPDRVAINPINGTVSYWAYIQEYGKSIRVVLRERDGTLINCYPDSNETRNG